MGKRDIEELFKERFKDFQEKPDDGVWQSIEVSLDKKKQKKRMVPIWWQLGGVAALLAILLYIINPFGPNTVSEDAVITDTEQKQENSDVEKDDSTKETIDSSVTDDQIQMADSDARLKEDKSAVAKDNKGVQSQGASDRFIKQEAEVAEVDKNTGAKTNSNNKTVLSEKTEEAHFDTPNEDNDAVASSKKPNKARTENPSNNQKSKLENVVSKKEEVAATDNAAKKEKSLLDNNLTEEESVANTDSETKEDDGGKSIYDVIEEQKNQEETALVENKANKWSVGPSVAPIYFSSIGEGSPIHSNFASNSKSGNINLSYGLTVAYDLGKRLTVRSGVHRVDFGYDTDDIVFSSSLSASTNGEIDNIDYNRASRNLVVQSKAANIAFSPEGNSTDLIARAPEFEGRMVQQMGYLEVPVELNYALVDKKFGVNLIGGVSSLFLIDNSVSLESDGLVTEMGEANNVNDINFSTNVGVGFNYEFSPKVQVNLEPVFKYQLNTFSDTAGDFRPFSVGVYSGVSFRF